MHLSGRGLLSSNKTRGTEKDILNVLDLVIHLTRGTEKFFCGEIELYYLMQRIKSAITELFTANWR